MPRRKFDKKTSTTYALVHRPQHDPLIHDENAPSQVFKEISGPSSHRSRVKNRRDLEEEFGFSDVRPNEGEAAEHGIYFDDSKYDYMQHLRDLDSGTDSTWVEAPILQNEKFKKNQNLADALRGGSLDFGDFVREGGVSLAGPSRFSGGQFGFSSRRSMDFQSQQDLPDAIAGFQPDMDPRLREVLEALDDEAYVDEEDTIFAELAGEGAEEVDQNEWESTRFDDQFQEDDEAGWESDDTAKPSLEYGSQIARSPRDAISLADRNSIDASTSIQDISTSHDGVWLAVRANSKTLKQISKNHATNSDFDSTLDSMASSSSLLQRKKNRKGALTSTSNYSMTSSALARTEPLSTLDDRFDRIAELYMEDDYEGVDDEEDDGVSLASFTTDKDGVRSTTGLSDANDDNPPKLVPAGFDAMLDEFLGSASGAGGKKGRRGGRTKSGIEQWDDFRKALGPAHLRIQGG